MSRRVIYTSPFVPGELIAACGLQPERIAPMPAGTNARLPLAGVCPFVRAFADAVDASDAVGVIVTCTCDQMRRASELCTYGSRTPVFLMSVPHAWQSEAAFQMYLSEVKRLASFLEEIGGAIPSEERTRQAAQDIPGKQSPIIRRPRDERVPVALIGGHLIGGVSHASELIEQVGGCVALDCTETGERCLPTTPKEGDLERDPLRAIASAHFTSMPDLFRRPNTEFLEWLERRIPGSGVRGAVLWRYVWCDTWHAEVQRIREAVGLPLLDLETTDDPSDAPRTLSRLQAFMETIR